MRSRTKEMVDRRLTRRDFVATAVAGAAAAGLSRRSANAAREKEGPQVCVFSKHLQFLDYPALAKTCRELGLDGTDLTVRGGGHVLPENVAQDLPAAVEALQGEGIATPMITTRLQRADDPDARPILEAASKLGIRYFRVGGHKYRVTKPILPQLAQVTEALRDLAALAAEYGMTAGYHNHSGMGNVGAPLWDLHRAYEAVGSPHLGANFDVGHATVEGAYGAWQITAQLLAPHVKMVAVKDFVFEGRKPRWVPLGEGVVETAAMLKIFRKAGFAGPISVHIEYHTASDDAMIEQVRASAKTLRACMKEAGYR